MSVDLSGQHLGHYLVHEVIGRGGMSVVYRATDQRLERSVALKVMSEHLSVDPEFRARFTEEARAASAIDHVNVVPLYDFGEVGGALFIAMRLVDGTDLARELANGPLPVRRVLNLLGQVGAALDMLHERGLVHLDVKPANVLITRNESVGHEHVYLADFGLTRRGTGDHRTASGDFLGSPTYASPEHLRGQEIVPRSDEYSLTCMLFTALAGRAPFVGDVRAVITGHLSGVVPSLSALTNLPGAIDRVIARGLAVEPGLRYASSSDLLSATRRAIASGDDEPSSAARDDRASNGSDPAGPGDTDLGPTSSITGAIPSPSVGRGAESGQIGASIIDRGSVRGPRASPAGHRPASHRIEPQKPIWPWVTAAAVVVIAAVIVFLLTRVLSAAGAPATGNPGTGSSSSSAGPKAPSIDGVSNPARVFPPGTLTPLAPSIVPDLPAPGG